MGTSAAECALIRKEVVPPRNQTLRREGGWGGGGPLARRATGEPLAYAWPRGLLVTAADRQPRSAGAEAARRVLSSSALDLRREEFDVSSPRHGLGRHALTLASERPERVCAEGQHGLSIEDALAQPRLFSPHARSPRTSQGHPSRKRVQFCKELFQPLAGDGPFDLLSVR